MKNLFNSLTFRQGFTLAEVLITLGIIGVVAAMTIPNLIANTNGSKFRNQFKKSLSTLNQAARMSQAQYDFSFAEAGKCTGANAAAMAAEHPESEMTICSMLNGTLTGHTVNGWITSIQHNDKYYVNDVMEGSASSGAFGGDIVMAISYSLADGSLIAFSQLGSVSSGPCELPVGTKLDTTWISNHKNCTGFIDVNGLTLPNKEVRCSVGTTTTSPDVPCVVKNDANHMTDIFPIVFHDSTVEPATNAAAYILRTSK